MKKRLLSMLRQLPIWLLFVLPFAAFSQDKVVTGKVTDSKDGSPIAGISVTVSGSKRGTVTAADGTFKIGLAPGSTRINVSGTGFDSQTISVVGKTDVTVALVATNNSLNEVVVIGYGTARKKDLTGSVASVGAKDFNKGISSSPDQLLQGKVAGLQITNNSGQPGAATTVKIRGNNSIRGGTTPLYVVDGVPLDGRGARPSFGSVSGLGNLPDVNPLIFLNPNDIASMDVLKDASASAIYGSRGANGVILVTTKKGQVGTKVEAGASISYSGLMKQPDILNISEYRTELQKFGFSSLDSGANVDAFKTIIQKKPTQNYSVALSGGNETGKYRASFLSSDQEGLIKKSSLKKYLANFNGQLRLLDNKLSLDFNLTASSYNQINPAISNDAGSTGNLISAAMNWNPTLTMVRSDGSYNQTNSDKVPNPAALLDYYDDNSKVTTILANISAGYKILPNLEYRFLYGINYGTGSRNLQTLGLIGAAIGGNAPGNGQAAIANAQLFSQTLTHTLNYNQKISTDLNFNATVGYEYYNTNYRSQYTYVYGFDYNTSAAGSPRLDIPYYYNMQDGNQSNLGTSSSIDPSVDLQSFFGRLNFNYKDKYLITGTFRADGSSRFGSNNRYAYFPSVAGAWNIMNEDFMKSNKIFSNLKLRLGYGQTGSQDGIPAGASRTIAYYAAFGGNVRIINYANPDLKWETVTAYNGGIDFGFFRNRLFGSFDLYRKKTTNPLFLAPLSVPSNGSSIYKNLPGDITNNGFEISLGGAIVASKDWNWNVSVNAAYNKNLFHYPGAGSSPLYLTGGVNGQGVSSAYAEAIADNHPIDVFYLRKFTGFDKNGIAQVQSQASDYQGDPNPTWIVGISTDVSYKKLSLAINAHGAYDYLIYNNTRTSVTNLGNIQSGKNISKTLINSSESLANPVSASTRFLENGNYMKLGNATLNYRLGKVGKTIKDMSIFFTGSNLFEITKYTGFDAEVNTDHNNNGVPSLGMDYIGYPTARTFLFGFNFTL